jgi:chromosome segregation ATPase
MRAGASAGMPADVSAGVPADISRAIGTLEAALAALERRAEAEATALRERVDQAEKQANQAESRAEQAIFAERSRAEALQKQVQGLLTQLGTLEADGKAVNDRAWAAGEAAGALREQVARLELHIETERARAEASAAHERQDFLDSESQTRRELDAIRQRLEQAEQGREATAAELHRQVEAAQIAQAEAEADAAELRQADDARKARGRLRRAWDGWRGR